MSYIRNSRPVSEHIAGFAKFATNARSIPSHFSDPKDILHETPCFSEEIFEQLPSSLKMILGRFRPGRERDIAFLSIITGCSALFSNVSGRYQNGLYYPNVNLMLAAPPASGKGTMILAEQICKNVRFAQFGGLSAEELIIPGDSSAAAMLILLKRNHGNGLLMEMEADTIRATLKKEWGTYSEILRKSFGHEPIVNLRKKKNQDIDDAAQVIRIDSPKLSSGISGTPDVIKDLLRSTENGLFSRILFYAFRERAPWRSIKATNERPLDQLVKEFSFNLNDIVGAYSSRDHDFRFTTDQQGWFDELYTKLLSYVQLDDDDTLDSIVKRLAVNHFRIAMLLSLLGQANTNEGVIKCNDTEFNIATSLAIDLLKHSFAIYKILPKHNGPGLNRGAEALLKCMESNTPYTLKDLEEIGVRIGVSKRSVSNYTEKLCGLGLLQQALPYKPYYKAENPKFEV